MFLGKHICTKDASNRFKIPDAFRSEATGIIYIIQGFEQNLLCLTEAPFREIFSRITSQNIANPLARILLRLILGSAHVVEVDPQGLLQIPEPLAGFINSDKDLCVIGQGDFFEIWSPESWKHQEAQLLDSEQNATRFSTLEITLR